MYAWGSYNECLVIFMFLQTPHNITSGYKAEASLPLPSINKTQLKRFQFADLRKTFNLLMRLKLPTNFFSYYLIHL